MNNFSWAKAIGFGVLLWAVMFMIAVILVAMGVTLGIGWMLVLAALGAIGSFSFALGTQSANSGQAIGYGLVWAVTGIVLSWAISSQIQTSIFGMWSYWVGYLAVALAPWVEYEVRGSGTQVTA